jgi:hypothetical protein
MSKSGDFLNKLNESGLRCGNCGDPHANCPECGCQFDHGRAVHCNGDACRKMNSPLDCAGCGMVVSNDKQGTLDYDMKLMPYIKPYRGNREEH